MPADLDAILKLEVPVIVQIGRRPMSVAEVMRLSHGSIVELPKRSDEDLEILVSNRVIGHGEVVKVGENFGIRVRRTAQIEERVEALGPPAAELNP
ncbi:MAG: FliM/FliN family flagellar motor switch protein [Phycisphaeraceae bacterium]|nr:FliM/FliN family flagellar motor switch protein [Phycisphaeraceae bacterium]